MAVIEIAKIQVRRGQELQTGTPTLDPGEFGWAQDTENLYIGKRIAEGAASDEPTRVLTENDLFQFLGSTATVTTPYQYRTLDAHINSFSELTSIQSGLDRTVSLTEFGVKVSSTATDIYNDFNTAVQTIFNNSNADSWQRRDARRELKIPAGHYYVSNTIELPPYTKLIGEGAELTRITFTNSATNLFRTVDAKGNDFDGGLMESGVYRAREVVIKGMTLEYSATATSNNALISLDNVLNATVEDCILRTAIDTTSTTTYGLIETGIGIEVRGIGGGIGAGDSNLCENIYIGDCTFDSLKLGVESTGSVVRPIIEHNVFNNLYQGISFTTGSISLVGPSNAHIVNNRFQNIVEEGIYVGPNLHNITTNHISEQNTFVQVGNGYDDGGTRPRIDDTVVAAQTYRPILTNVYTDSTGSVGTLFSVRADVLAITATYQTLTSIDVDSGLWYLKGDNHYVNDHILISGINTSTTSTLVFETTSTTVALDFASYPSESYTLEQAKPVKPVIKFESAGNKTVNDFFYRKIAADTTSTSGNFYYAPLVEGNVLINDSTSYRVALPPGPPTEFAKIPLTGSDQFVNVQYQMSGGGLSRKGKLTINVAQDGYTTLTDYYNYSQYLETTGTVFQANTVSSTITNIMIVDADPIVDAMFAEIIPTYYYVTGTAPYEGYSAIIKNAYHPAGDTSTWILDTESADPLFDYSVPGVQYTLLKGDAQLPEIYANSTSTYINKNYIVLTCNSESVFDLSLEYQIDTQI